MRGGLRARRREAAGRAGRAREARQRGERARLCAVWGAGRGEAADVEECACMSVTREVSQLSGWLKAHAVCRGSQAGHTVRGELCRRGWGRWRAIAGRAHSMQRERTRLQIGGRGTAERAATADWGTRRGEQRTENTTRMFVTREVSQLNSWLKAYARCREGRKHRAHGVRGGLQDGGRR